MDQMKNKTVIILLRIETDGDKQIQAGERERARLQIYLRKIPSKDLRTQFPTLGVKNAKINENSEHIR